jgi:hypothetical protein
MSVVFDVPMPPHVTNRARGSSHWRRGYAEKVAYWELLDTLQNCGRILPPPRERWARVSARSTMHLGGAMDDDNALARHKPLLDWLKTRGYLVDDRKKNVRWESMPDQVVKRDGNYRIVLTLTPVEP